MFSININKIDINTEPKRHFRELEMHIYMHQLSLLLLSPKRRIRALELQARVRAQHAFCYCYSKGIRDYVVKDVCGVHDSILLDIACSCAEIVVCGVAFVERFGFGHHAGIEGIEVGRGDCVGEDEDAVAVEGFEGGLQVVGGELFGGELGGGEGYGGYFGGRRGRCRAAG
jgi:hypothetical protein